MLARNCVHFILTKPIVLLVCFSICVYVNCKAQLCFVKRRVVSALWWRWWWQLKKPVYT